MLILRAEPKLAQKFSKQLRLPLRLAGVNLKSMSFHNNIWQGFYDVSICTCQLP